MATLLKASRHDSRFSSIPVELDLGGPVSELPLLQTLSRDELDELVAVSSSLRIGRQQVVFCEGERIAHLYLAQTGSFKLVRHSEQGKELILSIVHAGGLFGAIAEDTESTSLAQALEESVLLAVPTTTVRGLIAGNAPFAMALLQQAQTWHRRAETAAARLAFETVPGRLAHVILDESNGDDELAVPLNQTEIANLIGSSRETVCSILNQFRRQGLLQSDKGRLRILDRAGLASVR